MLWTLSIPVSTASTLFFFQKEEGGKHILMLRVPTLSRRRRRGNNWWTMNERAPSAFHAQWQPEDYTYIECRLWLVTKLFLFSPRYKWCGLDVFGRLFHIVKKVCAKSRSITDGVKSFVVGSQKLFFFSFFRRREENRFTRGFSYFACQQSRSPR